jgi:CubicO group peptidase (beta-lactamase class C family)
MKGYRYSFRTLPVMLIFVFLFVSFAFSKDFETAAPETVGMSSNRLARIDSILAKAVEQQRVKGVVAMIAKNSKVTYYKAFGEMDDGRPMQKDTIFRICSMSKPITAVAVMMLWEQGLFTLDDPIANYIPEFKDMKVLVMDKNAEKGYRLDPAKRPITIRQLLSHTSGLTYGFIGWPVIAQCYVDNDVSDGFRVTDGTIGDWAKRIAKCPLAFQPGEGWEYGLNLDVLGRFVEVVSGMPFNQFLQKNVFDPLKMKDTSFFVTSEKVRRLAALYEPTMEGGLKKVDRKVVFRSMMTDTQSFVYDPFYGYQGPKTHFSGGAGLHSTASDYLRFCQMLVNGGTLEGARLLSPSTINLMVQNHMGDHIINFSPKGMKYGLGFGVYTDPAAAGSSISKGAYQWLGIYNTKFFVDPTRRVSAVYFTQLFPNMQADDLMKKYETLVQQAIVRE